MPDATPSPTPDAATMRTLRALAGRFIVFEGPDGSGKSTQLKKLLDLLAAASIQTTHVREPGGTPVGEAIRNALLDHKHNDMGVRCETLLYMASRAELVEKRILPALRNNHAVLADRFVASTLAYQGAAGNLPTSDITAVARMATQNLHPDLIIVFDLDEHAAAKRLGLLLDRMEAKGAAFHRAVRQGYLDQARNDPGRYLVIDANASEDTVHQTLLTELAQRVTRFPPPRAR